jgi:hypothetical protein
MLNAKKILENLDGVGESICEEVIEKYSTKGVVIK